MTPPTPFPIDRDPSGIALLRLDQSPSPMVVLDHALIRRIEATLRSLPKDLTGLVLASASPRVFIAGADLKAIQAPGGAAATGPGEQGNGGLDDTELDRYLAYGQRVFGMLADLPFPTAAAINGAALGGGLEIAMHCDGLIASPPPPGKSYPIGLPEAGLSICPGWGGTNLLPARMDPAEAIRRTAEGKPMTYDEAAAAGLFDRLADSAETLIATARAWVADNRTTGVARRSSGGGGGVPSRWIGHPDRRSAVESAHLHLRESLPATDSAKAVLDAVRAGLDRGWQAALDAERRHLVRLRGLPAGRSAIQAFFDKAAKK